jgi:hypothetical protein
VQLPVRVIARHAAYRWVILLALAWSFFSLSLVLFPLTSGGPSESGVQLPEKAAESNAPDSNAALTPAIAASTPTVSVCGARSPSDTQEYTGPTLPSSPASTVIANSDGFFRYWAGPGSVDPRWYVLQSISTTQLGFAVYDAKTDNLYATFTIHIPANLQGQHSVGTFAVDPTSGNVFVGTYVANNHGGSVSSWSWTPGATPATNVILTTPNWSQYTTGMLVGGVYGYTDQNGTFRVAAVVGNGSSGTEAYSNTYDADGTSGAEEPGAYMGNNDVVGTVVNVSADDNDLVSADTQSGQYVRVYNSTGTAQTFHMGTSQGASGEPWHFYILTSANIESNGDIVVADSGHGLEFFSPSGVLLGTVDDNAGTTDPNPAIGASLTDDSNLQLVNGNYYFSTGGVFANPQSIQEMTAANADLIVNAPQGAPYVFGVGAGLYASAADNYFPSGTTPQVGLEFYPWWASAAANFTVQYTVSTIQQVAANTTGPTQSFALSSVLSGTPTGPVQVPLALPTPTTPDLYEVNAALLESGTVVGADCLRYSIGAPGDSFAPSALPSSQDAAAVAVAAELGQKLVRSSYDIDDCLTGVTTPTDLTALNCPAGMVTDVDAAAALAAVDGVQYEIEVADGGSLDNALISSGQWQRLVTAFVSGFPAVTDWEAWNEMNNTYSGNASTCVTQILEPFYNGVKAAAPLDTVVGGSVLNVSIGFWQAVGAAGGFQYMDVIGDHPYTGSNRSFEEEGQVALLQQLQSVIASDPGGAGKPIWDTESGFWSSGTDGYYSQGDKLVRKLILESSLGIGDVYNFMDIDSYDISGEVWGLIDSSGLDPGGLAAVTYGHILGGRTFEGWLPTSIPHSYAAEYGPSLTDPDGVVAVWSDDYTVSAQLTLSGGGPATVTSEYGGANQVPSGSAFSVGGAVQYVTVPLGQTLSIHAGESFGANYAAAADGATASASATLHCGSGYSPSPGDAIGTGAPGGVAVDNAEGYGDLCDGIPAWTDSVDTDPNPTLTVTLAAPEALDRIYISGQGLGSVETGLRSFDVQVNSGSGFNTVASVTNNFFQRDTLVTFSPRANVSAIRITDVTINYSGYGDGLPPNFWSSSFSASELATIYDVEAYGPGTTNAPPPTVSSVAPDQGPAATTVTLTGSGLSWTTSISFGAAGTPGAVSTTSFIVDSDAELTVTVPGSAAIGSLPVQVHSPGGVSPEVTGATDYDNQGLTLAISDRSSSPAADLGYLVGAVFQVSAPSGASLGTFVTGPGAPIELTGLVSGTYQVTQTTAPAGYFPDPNPASVVVSGAYPTTSYILSSSIIPPPAPPTTSSPPTTQSPGRPATYTTTPPGVCPVLTWHGNARLATAVGISAVDACSRRGYYIADAAGHVDVFGGAEFYGDLTTQRPAAPIIAITATADARGYWMVDAAGHVYSFGDAGYFGGASGFHLNAPIVAMATTGDGRGYWLLARDGGVFSFGDAAFFGSAGGMKLNAPVVGIAVAPGGKGYWIVAADGGVFAFTPDGFYGSEGGVRLNRPVIGMAGTADGHGYTLVAADGGVFNFGDSRFYGSLGASPPVGGVASLAATPDNTGYYLLGASAGAVYAFGPGAPYLGGAA